MQDRATGTPTSMRWSIRHKGNFFVRVPTLAPYVFISSFSQGKSAWFRQACWPCPKIDWDEAHWELFHPFIPNGSNASSDISMHCLPLNTPICTVMGKYLEIPKLRSMPKLYRKYMILDAIDSTTTPRRVWSSLRNAFTFFFESRRVWSSLQSPGRIGAISQVMLH